MYLTRKIMRALNMRLLSAPDDYRREAEEARKIVAEWRLAIACGLHRSGLGQETEC